MSERFHFHIELSWVLCPQGLSKCLILTSIISFLWKKVNFKSFSGCTTYHFWSYKKYGRLQAAPSDLSDLSIWANGRSPQLRSFMEVCKKPTPTARNLGGEKFQPCDHLYHLCCPCHQTHHCVHLHIWSSTLPLSSTPVYSKEFETTVNCSKISTQG